MQFLMGEKERKTETGGDRKPPTGRIEKVTRNEEGQLVVRVEGHDEPVVDARVVRCFPWSLPDGYLAVRTRDGHEMALLNSLDELDPASRKVVEQELHDKVFNPRIRRIVSHKHEFGVASLTAETDRGTVSFQIRSRDDVRTLSPTRALFRDVDGNTYELPDLARLDSASRKHLERYF